MGISCFNDQPKKNNLLKQKSLQSNSYNASAKNNKFSVIEQEPPKYAFKKTKTLDENTLQKEKGNISKDEKAGKYSDKKIIKEKNNDNGNEIKSKEIIDKENHKSKKIKSKKNNDNENKDIKSQRRKSYQEFNLNQNYYIICPDCNYLQPFIEDLKYDTNKDDIFISYICECNKTKKAKNNYLVNCISPKKPSNEKMELISNKNCEKLNSLLNDKKEVFKGNAILKKLLLELFPINGSIAPPIKINSINQNLDNHIEISQNFVGSVLPMAKEKNTRKYKCIKTLEGNNIISSIIQLSSGLIATGSYDSKILIWNIEEAVFLKCIQENGYVLSLLEFKQNFLLSGTSSNTISLWDLSSKNNDCIFKFEGHGFWVNCLVKCNENFFASGSNDKTIRIWNYNERKEIRTINAHSNIVDCLILLKNGNLCSGGDDNLIKIWNWKNGELIYEIKGHQNDIKCLHEFNEEFLISGSDDKTIKIWENYQEKKNINGHNEAIVDLCLIDENTFASGSFDFTIKIWDINSLDCLQTLDEHKDKITGIIKLKNKNILVSCSCDETVKVWKQD